MPYTVVANFKLKLTQSSGFLKAWTQAITATEYDGNEKCNEKLKL